MPLREVDIHRILMTLRPKLLEGIDLLPSGQPAQKYNSCWIPGLKRPVKIQIRDEYVDVMNKLWQITFSVKAYYDGELIDENTVNTIIIMLIKSKLLRDPVQAGDNIKIE